MNDKKISGIKINKAINGFILSWYEREPFAEKSAIFGDYTSLISSLSDLFKRHE